MDSHFSSVLFPFTDQGWRGFGLGFSLVPSVLIIAAFGFCCCSAEEPCARTPSKRLSGVKQVYKVKGG